jgi:hypothetical protein
MSFAAPWRTRPQRNTALLVQRIDRLDVLFAFEQALARLQ